MREGEVLTPRTYPRYPSTTTVRIHVAHAWEGTSRREISGALRDVSRGGAGVVFPLVLPPRTLLTLVFPDVPGLRLPAEIVWTSTAPGLAPAASVAGVRWLAHIPRQQLATMVPGYGVSAAPGDSSPPRA